MKFFTSSLLAAALPLLSAIPAIAGDTSGLNASTAISTPDTRYGPLDLFDHRSNYGEGVFPEPFLVDDSDLEQGEFRIDWLHTASGANHTDQFTGELEHGFGLVTLELEVPGERDYNSGKAVSGFDNINPGIRAPFYMYVSPSGFVNTTLGTALEAGIPTHSAVSRNTEVVPKLFNDLALGDHFTLQSIFGYSMLYGPKGAGEEGGLNTFEYGFVFGYTIPHQELAIPHVQQVIPVFELQGYKALDNGEASQDQVFGNAAIRINTDTIGGLQPRLGVGFVFPMDSAAREVEHWGIYTSLVFEF
jgi:hypothetical protein